MSVCVCILEQELCSQTHPSLVSCAARPGLAGWFAAPHSLIKDEQYAASLPPPPALKSRLLRVIGSLPGRVWALRGRSITKHRRRGSGSMGISCFSVDLGSEGGWGGGCQPTLNFTSPSDRHPNEPVGKGFLFFSLSASPQRVCVCLRGQTGVIPPLACIPSLSPSHPCVQSCYGSKLGPADSVTGRPGAHHTGCQVGRRRQIKQIKGRSEGGDVDAIAGGGGERGERAGERRSGRREDRRDVAEEGEKVATTPN